MHSILYAEVRLLSVSQSRQLSVILSQTLTSAQKSAPPPPSPRAVSNIYCGTIYAKTPKALPSASRTTGSGICIVLNRIGGVIGVLVGAMLMQWRLWLGAFVWVLYGAMVSTSLLLPLETRGKCTVHCSTRATLHESPRGIDSIIYRSWYHGVSSGNSPT